MSAVLQAVLYSYFMPQICNRTSIWRTCGLQHIDKGYGYAQIALGLDLHGLFVPSSRLINNSVLLNMPMIPFLVAANPLHVLVFQAGIDIRI